MLNILLGLSLVLKESRKKMCVALCGLFFLFFLGIREKNRIKISYIGQVDYISWWLIGLILWLVAVCFLMGGENFRRRRFGAALVFLEIFVVLRFFVRDFFGFYVFFEARLIPIIFLIVG